MVLRTFRNDCEQRGPLNEHPVVAVRARGVVCQPVSTLKAEILNITYDCYCQNDNTVNVIIGDDLFCSILM